MNCWRDTPDVWSRAGAALRRRPGLMAAAVSVLVAGIAMVVVGRLWADLTAELPDRLKLAAPDYAMPLRIVTRDGQLIARYGSEQREPLEYEDLPPLLVDAFVAAEDHRYFDHPGVDLRGLLRAFYVTLIRGDAVQGGSTITMQTARNLYLSPEQTIRRKLREMIIALKLERLHSKDRILQAYLNVIYFGHGAYGVQSAARTYYGRDVAELSLAETAMLAALPKAPSLINPIANPRAARERRNYVLDHMLALGMIDEQAHEQARAADITARLRQDSDQVEAMHLAEMARLKAVELFGEDAYSEGLVVTTTIDSEQQREAVQAVRDGLLDYDSRQPFRGVEGRMESVPRPLGPGPLPARLAVQLDAELAAWPDRGGLRAAAVLAETAAGLDLYLPGAGRLTLGPDQSPWRGLIGSGELRAGDIVRVRRGAERVELAQLPEVQGAFVAMDPADGAVTALVGSFDFALSQYNRAVQARRQTGSVFKPFVYSAALEQGFHPASIVNDAPLRFELPGDEGAWQPRNYGGWYLGPIRVRQALVQSRNLATLDLARRLSIGEARGHITRFGFAAERVPRNLAMALGSASFTPLEVARGYATFANGGYAVQPYWIESIRDHAGNELYRTQPVTVPDRSLPVDLLQAGWDPDEYIRARREMFGAFAAELPRIERPQWAPRVLSEANAFIMTSLMQDVIREGTGRRAQALGRDDIAGKTGTTNDHRDAWFSGFHPELVATAWIGHDRPRSLGAQESGGRTALPVWTAFMDHVLADRPQVAQRVPLGVREVRIDVHSGGPVTPETGEVALEYLPWEAVAEWERSQPQQPGDERPLLGRMEESPDPRNGSGQVTAWHGPVLNHPNPMGPAVAVRVRKPWSAESATVNVNEIF